MYILTGISYVYQFKVFFFLQVTCPNWLKNTMFRTAQCPPPLSSLKFCLFLLLIWTSSINFRILLFVLCYFLWCYMIFILCFLQLRNAPNFLRHEHTILVRWFSNNAQPSIGKRDGMLIIFDYLVSTFLFISDQVN